MNDVWVKEGEFVVVPSLGVRVPLEGHIGNGKVEMAFCKLLQGAIRERWIEMEKVYACPLLEGAAWCKLAGGKHVCPLLLEDPEGNCAWQLAWQSVNREAT